MNPVESNFLMEIYKTDSDEVVFIYSDWLEENGYSAKAEVIRWYYRNGYVASRGLVILLLHITLLIDF